MDNLVVQIVGAMSCLLVFRIGDSPAVRSGGLLFAIAFLFLLYKEMKRRGILGSEAPTRVEVHNGAPRQANLFGNINLFVPAICVAVPALGLPIAGVISQISGSDALPPYAIVLCILLPVVCVVTFTVKRGLVPSRIDPNLEGRYGLGNTIVALGSLIVIGSAILPFWLSSATGNGNWAALMWVWLFTIPLGGGAWAVGLGLIHSARA